MNVALAFLAALLFASSVLAQSSVAAAAKTLSTAVPDAKTIRNTIPSTPQETWEESDIGFDAQMALQGILGQVTLKQESAEQVDPATDIETSFGYPGSYFFERCPAPKKRVLGKYLFFTKQKGSIKYAREFCARCGGRLVEIYGSYEVSVLQRLITRIGLVSPVYIGSWNGDHYRGAPIALFPGGAIAVPVKGARGPYYGLCEYVKYV